ncbi:MAG: Asp-tRNA(Asn)/Glu-tRNA(Gln) amidotransferase subunit GatC [Chromatiales bacterium]|jgi:aspartyl-tRNA(Asn)/glutamyl-tRNA(Gln) amidotransferase subunit C|nr:Asp-tRNA(Asn)/Glu-tRNA(Gln) amidotransferase subunit GatC [Chromatiales bacterium]
MSLSEVDVERIAHLARMQIADSDAAPYAKSLSGILDFVARMNAIDTEGVEPMAHPLHAVQRLREDAITENDQRDLFQAHAPLVQDGLYLVPRVIE